MMGLRDIARKGLGLLVDLGEEPGLGSPAPIQGIDSDSEYLKKLRSRSVGDLLEELDGPGLQQIEAGAQAAAAVPPLQNGQVDFTAIYAQSSIDVMPFGAERTLELIQSYPADMTVEVRRQALDAALKPICTAMNVTKEALVTDATRKLNALAGFVDATQKERDAVAGQAQEKIRSLREQIQAEEARVSEAEATYRAIVEQCEAEGERLDQVQEILTLDREPSAMAIKPGEGPRPPGTR